MRKLLLAVCLLPTLHSFAKGPDDSTKVLLEQLRIIDSVESTFKYQTGTVVLPNGLATINIAPGYKFLGAADTKYVIEEVWGNLKGQTSLGMIVPEHQSASISDYAFIIEYEAIGFVKDDDADDINYDDLLKQLKEDVSASNIQRRQAGIPTMDIIGWAAKPHYDKDKKLLYWAKEFKVENEENNTLNYDIRLLGRKGVLVLQAVSSMANIDSVNKNISSILGMVSFNKGNQYSDYDSTTDQVAAWTIGGLVAGKILAKAGFFVLVLKNIKLIILGIFAIGGGIWRYITGRRKRKEVDMDPLPVTADQS